MSRFAVIIVLVGAIAGAYALPPYLGIPYATTATSFSLPYRGGFAYAFPAKAAVPAIAGYAAPFAAPVAGIAKAVPVPALPGLLPAGYASPIPPVGVAPALAPAVAGPVGFAAPAVGPVPAVGPYGPAVGPYGPAVAGPVAGPVPAVGPYGPAIAGPVAGPIAPGLPAPAVLK